jgi:two-component system OmpR family sensor kinase
MRGLSARILALSLGLVLATTIAAGLATVQFARASASSEQRAELVAQASLITLQSARLATPRFLHRVARGLDGSVLTVTAADGTVVTSTAPHRSALLAATTSTARRAAAGADVSTSVQVGARTELVEARPIDEGGAIVLSRPLRALSGAAAALVGRILVVLVVALVVAAIAAVWLSRRIALPLTATARAARRLAQGDRGVPVPEGAPGEVGDVADALRALDVALARSESRQREFLLSVSHELRTPLTALRGYGEALADGLVTGDRVREVGGVLVTETERVERFTADLLELARLEADDFSVDPADVELGGIATEAAHAWRARAEAAGIELRLDGFGARGSSAGAAGAGRPDRERRARDPCRRFGDARRRARTRHGRRRGGGHRPGALRRGPRGRLHPRPAARAVPGDPRGRHGTGPVDRDAARDPDGRPRARRARTHASRSPLRARAARLIEAGRHAMRS